MNLPLMQQVGVDNFHTASLFFLLKDFYFFCKMKTRSLNTNVLQLSVFYVQFV